MTVFSRDYLYGDYTRLNPILMESYHLTIPRRAGEDTMKTASEIFPDLPFFVLDKVYEELAEITERGEELANRQLQLLDRKEIEDLLERAVCAFWKNSQVKNLVESTCF